MKGNRAGGHLKLGLAALGLLSALLPVVTAPSRATAADVVLPPILLAGPDAEDSGSGNGAASRVNTWSYQIRNPNPFDLTATIDVNTAPFSAGETGPPAGSWVPTQVVAVSVPANSMTPVTKRLDTPPALGVVAAGSSYGLRARWDAYPTVESNYVGLHWPQALTIPSSLGAAFTDPGLPFVGGGDVIEGFTDNRGPDFAAAFACEFDTAGNPTSNYVYYWWVQNSAFTGNPELLNVELARANGSLMPGVSGLARQTVDWAATRSAVEIVNGSAATVATWQAARGWFRPAINKANPGGTAGDNTWPWDGSTPPGSVWALNGSPYDKHTRPLLHADDCATKYADLPAPGTEAPMVTIVAPPDGATVADTVVIQIAASDDDAAGTLDVQVSTDGGAAWSAAAWNPAIAHYEYSWDTTGVADGSVTIDARATDSDGNTTNAAPIGVTVDNAADPTLVVAAGDIGSCGLTSDDATGALLDEIFSTATGLIAIPGDVAYPDGTPADFDCFDDAWGQHKPLMRPAPGNHDYITPGAAGYFGYFGAQAGDPAEGYYTYPIDDYWMGISLNSNCGEVAGGCAAGGAQEQWLRSVLAASGDKNVLAYWHHPRWSNNFYNDNPNTQPLWQALYEYGADLVLVGHEHHYERYQPLDATGSPDPAFGIREFIVGTGGITLRAQQRAPSPYSEEQFYDDHGVLKLMLEPASYSWEFVSVGGSYTDSGSQPVHGAPQSPTVTITAPDPGAVVSGTTPIEVSAADDDPVGTLTVDVSTDGGSNWAAAPWNAASGRYEYSWDTTSQPDGAATIDARATDSDATTGYAPQVAVTIDNAPSSDYRTTVIADGADVYWRLADPTGTVATDELGSNDATYVGDPALGVPGLVADGTAAVDFDGFDDAVHLTNSAEINQGGPYFTKSIELWFSVTGITARQTLYEQGDIARGVNLYVHNGLLYAGIYNTSDNGGDTPWGPIFLSTPVSAGQPHHAVMVFDQPADSFSLYLDGTLAASAGGVGALHNHGLAAFGSQRGWARYHDGAQPDERNFVDGTIDEVALYPVALGAATVADHYALGAATGPQQPTATITSPSPGAVVAGNVVVEVAVSDDDPASGLSVEVSTDAGSTWNPATWNGALARYVHDWDTTRQPDGPATIEARVTDSDGNITFADPVSVTIDNESPPGYRDRVIGDGAWIYWRLGEAAGLTVADELGSNPQTYSGTPTLGVTGLIAAADTAVDFDGVDDTIRLVNSPQINQTDPFLTKTIELWFRATDVSSRQVILEQGSVSRGLNIYLRNRRLYAGIYNTADDGGDTPWGPVFLSARVSADTTYHVVVVFDQPADTFSLYVNGALVDSDTGIGQLYSHGRSAIGSQWDWARYHDGARFGDQYFFAGTLDEIAVYPGALSAAAIADHYTAGTP